MMQVLLVAISSFFLFAHKGYAEESCGEGKKTSKEYTWSKDELSELTADQAFAGFGKLGCIYQSESERERFEQSVRADVDAHLTRKYESRFRSDASLGENEGVSCRVEFEGIPDLRSSFDLPETREPELRRWALEKKCPARGKQNNFVWGHLDWTGLKPKIVCENIWLIGCKRSPSTLGPAVLLDRAPAILKRPQAEDEATGQGSSKQSIEVR